MQTREQRITQAFQELKHHRAENLKITIQLEKVLTHNAKLQYAIHHLENTTLTERPLVQQAVPEPNETRRVNNIFNSRMQTREQKIIQSFVELKNLREENRKISAQLQQALADNIELRHSLRQLRQNELVDQHIVATAMQELKGLQSAGISYPFGLLTQNFSTLYGRTSSPTDPDLQPADSYTTALRM